MPLIETFQQRMIAAPFIHLNGSSAARMAEDYADLTVILREALEALAKIAPNERDYYPERVSYFETARKQHVERVNALNGVLFDIEALHEHVEEHG